MKVDAMNHPVSGAASWPGHQGRRILVVGAGGIGQACIGGFLSAGARVVAADVDETRLKELGAVDDRLFTCVIDLTTEGAGTELVDKTRGLLGGLDVLVHCVGINDRRPILDLTEADWDRILRVNLLSAFGVVQAAGRHMVDQGSGSVIVLSSVSGWLAHAHHGPYAASKGGINQMVRVMAREWASSGVTVNAVAPGYIETNLTADYLARPGVRHELTALVPAGRLGRPDDVVGPVLFLASEHAAFVTGHVLTVDGGRTLV